MLSKAKLEDSWMVVSSIKCNTWFFPVSPQTNKILTGVIGPACRMNSLKTCASCWGHPVRSSVLEDSNAWNLGSTIRFKSCPYFSPGGLMQTGFLESLLSLSQFGLPGPSDNYLSTSTSSLLRWWFQETNQIRKKAMQITVVGNWSLLPLRACAEYILENHSVQRARIVWEC